MLPMLSVDMIRVISADSTYSRMTIQHRNHAGNRTAALKGERSMGRRSH